MEDKQFGTWLVVKIKKDFAAFVKRYLNWVATMGINGVKSHMQSDSHRSTVKGRQQLTV